MRTFIQNRLPIILAALLLPQIASAQGAAVIDIMVDLYNSVFPIVFTVGILVTVIIGITLVSTTDESQMAKAKGALISLLAGAFLIKLVPVMLEVFHEQQVGTFFGGGIFLNPDNVNVQLIGIADWFVMLAVVVAVFTIIIAGFRAVASFGSENAISAARRSALHGIAGILILVLISAARIVIFQTGTPNILIQEIFLRVNIVLGLVAIVMIAILIYAGVLMILSVAHEGNTDKAKGLIFRAIIGLIVVLLSVVLVQIIINVFS